MYRKSTVVLVILIGLFMTGCANMSAVTTIVEEAGKTTTTLTGAAVQRDIVYADERKWRDEQSEKMYKKSGVVITNKMYTLSDGTQAFLPEKIEARAPHRYQQNIETRPPDHRGWDSLDKGIDVLGTAIIGGVVKSIVETSVDSAQPKYGGDYIWNPQTAEPFVIEPVIIQ